MTINQYMHRQWCTYILPSDVFPVSSEAQNPLVFFPSSWSERTGRALVLALAAVDTHTAAATAAAPVTAPFMPSLIEADHGLVTRALRPGFRTAPLRSAI